jgi:hypothetical protein
MTIVIRKKIPQVKKSLRDKLFNQAKKEILIAREYQTKRHSSWKEIETEVFAQKRINTNTSRANVKLFQMREFLDMLISKIDAPMDFDYSSGSNKAKENEARNLNALKDRDKQPQHGNWAMKDYMAKEIAATYGRVIYEMHAESKAGNYRNILTVLDVYDFMIDPNVSGIDMETALYMGRYGIRESLHSLKEGVKSGVFIRSEVNSYTEQLEAGAKIDDNLGQQQTSKQNRESVVASKPKQATDYLTLWEWYTTYDGERYYLLMNEEGLLLRCHKLTDVFSSGLFPFASWAYYPNAFEFWTPSPCEIIRDIVILQEKNINQIVDNVESINKPQRAVVAKMIENMSDLKYRRGGIIKLKGDGNLNIDNIYQSVKTPEITSPLVVYEKMNAIVQRITGMSDSAQGIADEKGKVGIFEGNLSAAADRFARIEKSYSDGYAKLALLYYYGVRDHLTRKTAIEVQGENGVETIKINRGDVGNEPFPIVVTSSIVQNARDKALQRRKLDFLMAQGERLPNQMKALELEADIVGFSKDEISQLMAKDYGSSQVLAEASRDLQELIKGRDIELNLGADRAYAQYMMDYLRTSSEYLNETQVDAVQEYIQGLFDEGIVVENTARNIMNAPMEEAQSAEASANNTQNRTTPGGDNNNPLNS